MGRVMHRGGSPGVRLLPSVLTIIMVVAITVLFWRLWSDDPSYPRKAEQRAGSSSPVRPSSGDSAMQETTGDQIERDAKTGARDDSGVVTKLHKNQEAGYSFRYPVRWKLETEQTVSRLTRPDRHFVISFGLGPTGGLPVAYDEFVALMDETYADVSVGKVDATHVKDSVGVVARGAATGSAGVRVRFLATVIERPHNERAIGALAATDRSSGKFPPAVLEILASFRPI
jgi:hypothetical protein